MKEWTVFERFHFLDTNIYPFRPLTEWGYEGDEKMIKETVPSLFMARKQSVVARPNRLMRQYGSSAPWSYLSSYCLICFSDLFMTAGPQPAISRIFLAYSFFRFAMNAASIAPFQVVISVNRFGIDTLSGRYPVLTRIFHLSF